MTAPSQSYAITLANATVVADATLVILRSATSYSSRASVNEVLRIVVSQNGTSTSQQLGIIVAQKASAFGTYTSATPSPLSIGTVASGISGSTSGAAAGAGTNASAEGAGTVTNIWSDGFNNLNGYLWIPTPDERIIIGPDLALIVKLRGTPTTLTGWNATVIFRELT
jgi:hypothetical protein